MGHENSVSVKDHGAVGDGIVDDSAAFRSALIEAERTRRALYWPPGEYKITSTIDLT